MATSKTLPAEDLGTSLRISLEMLKVAPKPLAPLMTFAATTNELDLSNPIEQLTAHLQHALPNDPVLNVLGYKIREWDNIDQATWAESTPPHSEARRSRMYELLRLTKSAVSVVNEKIPLFTRAARATVIALAHESWYEKRSQRLSHFYWERYRGQLAPPKGRWSSTAVSALGNSITDVVSRLSDPERPEIYQVKGLVVGYVQSGKTAHFTGLIAKAADAGYKLVIVLAGTMNVLRRQTQRRIDKELLGQELLAGTSYTSDGDWNTFIKHGGRPSTLGSSDWERLTDLEDDYASLGARLGALQFHRTDPSKPFNDPVNLRSAPARLVVIKKMPLLINKLADDLVQIQKLGDRLDRVPTLIIDDESDQASINTIRPNSETQDKKRTTTNEAIIRLLSSLPRAQYVGYTATPFANVFIDPTDAEQLFPKDFIVSLPRPEGYMGVSDFFDLEADPGIPGPNERKYVRNVIGTDNSDENLPKAIDSYVLAGAMKLFRSEINPELFRFRHHTMLVHHAATRVVHNSTAENVRALFEQGRVTSAAGRRRLKALFETDFQKFSDDQYPYPKDFAELEPYIGQCVAKIRENKTVLIVNGDERNVEDTPDFDSGSIWAILVGGAKLSRGYTVEGLTTTYYRRITSAADTLMQMGRWFGFRPGYADLVRWFVGRHEPTTPSAKKHVDLYAQFGAICRDEEAFRKELTRYADDKSIKPSQVPPLVYSHLPSLKPTGRNKMYNAQLTFVNYSGKRTEKASVSRKDANFNSELTSKLLSTTKVALGLFSFNTEDGAPVKFDAYHAIASKDDVLSFLKRFRWSNDMPAIQHELEYLSGKHGDPCIDDWLVMLPQAKSGAEPWAMSSLPKMTISYRAAVDDAAGRFNIFSEPAHVKAAAYIAGVTQGSSPNQDISDVRRPKRGVLIMYRVRPTSSRDAAISIGFAVQFPQSKIQSLVAWTVADPNHPDAVVVAAR